MIEGLKFSSHDNDTRALSSGMHVLVGERNKEGHIFLRIPPTDTRGESWELNPDNSVVEKITAGNNNLLFAGAMNVQLARMKGATELLTPDRKVRGTVVSQGIYFTGEYQEGITAFADSLRAISTLNPDLQVYPNIQQIDKGSGLVAESAFMLAAHVLELPIGISDMSEDHSSGDFFYDQRGRRTYWDLTATPNEQILKQKKIRDAKCSPLFFPLKTGNYIRNLPLYASKLNGILNNLRMENEGITPEMLMRGDISLAKQLLTRSDALAIMNIIHKHTRDVLFTIYNAEEISDLKILQFVAHLNLFEKLVTEAG